MSVTGGLDARFFIQDVPEIELRDGMFTVCYQVGRKARFEVVIPPHVYLKALRRATVLAAQFHDGKRNVIAIGCDDPEPAHG